MQEFLVSGFKTINNVIIRLQRKCSKFYILIKLDNDEIDHTCMHWESQLLVLITVLF